MSAAPGAHEGREPPPLQRQLSQAQLGRFIRASLATHLYDESQPCTAADALPRDIALYTLADPRELRQVRYVGQTAAPRRRLLQHLGTARLWLPDELPWWVRSPRLRPLYHWIRELYRDGRRLPVMVVSAWVGRSEARRAEREQIIACLMRQSPLLNVEMEPCRWQPPLL